MNAALPFVYHSILTKDKDLHVHKTVFKFQYFCHGGG
jgi:hypothetical protein